MKTISFQVESEAKTIYENCAFTARKRFIACRGTFNNERGVQKRRSMYYDFAFHNFSADQIFKTIFFFYLRHT